ncbi:MAG TPA: ABC transporter ATP-binding protein [Stellaceae bacterium]|nr:ABC transporter ATP-binding protein [Stellaceae bacterium]
MKSMPSVPAQEVDALLRVKNLRINFRPHGRTVEAVRGVSFAMGREKLAIVGESGSGKSLTARSFLKLVQPIATVTAERLEFRNIDILRQTEREMRRIRGSRITMVMQDPRYSLNPVIKVGNQVAAAARLHQRISRGEARAKALQMFESVHIRDPERVYELYPHEVSGGMGQRVMLAIMLITDPEILIADEATSALDVTVQLQVLSILDEQVRMRGMGLLFISHDLNLVQRFCERIIVMRRGEIVETIAAADLRKSTHPYTRGLLESAPRIGGPRTDLPVLNRAEG